MPLPRTVLISALVALANLACGEEEVVNGFGTYGSGKLQGFVSRADGSPVAEVFVIASFGPGAFVISEQTDARGLYELEATSYTPLDQVPFTDGVVQSRITVGEGLADTLVMVRFAPSGQNPVPVTVNFVVTPPSP
jgi:hypothetical protein